MPNTADPGLRLQEMEELIEDWKRQVLENVQQTEETTGSVDDAFAERFTKTNDRLLELNERLHPEDFDHEAIAEIRGIIIDGIRAHQEVGDDRPLDLLDDFLVRAEAIRHIVRDAIDGHVRGVDDDAKPILAMLRQALPRMKQKDLARLVGRSPRQVQRYSREGGVPTRRLQLVGRMVALLQRGWTEEGVLAWFERPRRDLDGKKPIDLLDDPAYEQRLMTAVKQGRAQHGS